MQKANVLGTVYEIHDECSRADYPILEDYDGYCDYSTKRIYVVKMIHEKDSLQDLGVYKAQLIRHELIHAFLFESGLAAESDWAQNEELVDWIAAQFPKMQELFTQLLVRP